MMGKSSVSLCASLLLVFIFSISEVTIVNGKVCEKPSKTWFGKCKDTKKCDKQCIDWEGAVHGACHQREAKYMCFCYIKCAKNAPPPPQTAPPGNGAPPETGGKPLPPPPEGGGSPPPEGGGSPPEGGGSPPEGGGPPPEGGGEGGGAPPEGGGEGGQPPAEAGQAPSP